jgi:hypothetical protein
LLGQKHISVPTDLRLPLLCAVNGDGSGGAFSVAESISYAYAQGHFIFQQFQGTAPAFEYKAFLGILFL